MSLWSDAEYRFFPFYFPHAPLHLHIMLTACGFEVRRDHTYDWNGLQRGDRPFCIFQCTLEGEGQLTVDGKAYRMKPGDAMLLSVPENHRYTLPSDSTHWKHIYLNFSGSEAVRIWTELKHKYGSVVHLPLERSKTLETAFSVWTAAKNKRIRSALRASAFAYDFLMTLSEELAELELAQSEASFALDAVKYCMDHYAEDITVAEIADAAGYSRCHFSRMFTRVHGTSPGAFLRELRLGHAARILRMENCSVKETAARCGFADESYFCRAFRLRYGTTPDLYRKNH